jgi:type I restriction enzyme M protein
MARQKKNPDKKKTNGAALGFEATLWAMADKQRGHMYAAEYKHVVLGLIFLKYISDAFEEKHATLVEEKKKGADPEDRDESRTLAAQRDALLPKLLSGGNKGHTLQ